jgi:hypothetical protein
MSEVTFDELNHELRNVVPAFKDRVPDNFRWTIDSHEEIVPGTTLGFWHWADNNSESPIVAPANCHGHLIDVNDRIEPQSLGTSPSQMLFMID